MAMRKLVRGLLMAAVFVAPLGAVAEQNASSQETAAARSKDGKKLFGTAEALRLARVSSPRISPDGARVAYLLAENVMDKEKDTAWKSVTQLWVVPTSGPATAARQFTRGEKSVSNIEWSPDGKLLAFTMDAGDEKDAKPQVWFMYADGGEPFRPMERPCCLRRPFR
jgi:dipeptidyl aminopeptidase/acylaminoacyl peptidase